MKTYNKTRAVISVLLSWVLIFSLVPGVLPVSADTEPITDQFYADGVKFQPSAAAPQSKSFSDSRRGLLMTAYESGSTAAFRKLYHGVFEAELKASTEGTSSPDLGAWSLIFTDVFTGESFALTVEDKGTELQAYVTVGEDTAGIFYNVSKGYNGGAHGYTSLQNESGNYTRIITAKTTKVRFDPSTMEVSIQDESGYEMLIWDLSEEIVDGKRFPHVVDSMDSYGVTLEFSKVKAGGKGQLIIYNICGEDYSGAFSPASQAAVYAHATANPVVGQAYTLPVPSIYDAEGVLSLSDITYTVYNNQGVAVAEGAYTETAAFTPEMAGDYFVYYLLQSGDVKGDTYVKIQAVSQENVTVTFSEARLTAGTYGLNTTMEIPMCSVASSLFFQGYEEDATVTILKDGTALADYTAVPAGFTYTFDAIGTYQVVYGTVLAGKLYEADPIQLVISEEVPGIVAEDIPASFYTGDTYTIPEMTVYLGGTSGKATHTVTLSDGSQVTDSRLLLSKPGNYTVTYIYDVAGQQGTVLRTFTVQKKITDIFTSANMAEYAYSPDLASANIPGVVVTMTSDNSYITCDVDLSDNTKNNNLIDLMTVARTLGAEDCIGFYVTLTDKLNPDNYVTIRIHQGSGSSGETISNIRARASNQVNYTGWYKSPDWDAGAPYPYTNQLETIMAHNFGGFCASHNFRTSSFDTDIEECQIQLSWDTQEKALYCSSQYQLASTPDKNECLVVDFDDPVCFTSLWSGFTDDSQVELKISPMSVSGSARFKISQIDGMMLDSEIVADEQAPIATLDMEGMTAIPDAATGMPYRVLNLKVNDNLSDDNLIHTAVTVTHNGNPVELTNNTFVPTADGVYLVTYTVTDAYGNETVLTTSVRARSGINPVSAQLTGSWQETAEYGFPITLPAYQGNGGTGRYYYSAQVTHNGVTEDITGNSYTPMEEGSYTVTLIASDYIGQTAMLTHSYDVVYRPVFVVDESKFIMPPSFISGSIYTFDQYIQGYYQAAGQEITMVNAKIEVEDADGIRTLDDSRNYTPKASDTVQEAKVRFLFEGNAGGKTIQTVVEKSVPIRIVSQSSAFMTDHFLLENATGEAKNQFVTFRSTGEDSKITFLRPVAMEVFNLEMKPTVVDGVFQSNYDAIHVTLTDRADPTVSMVLTISQNGERLDLSVNGGNPIRVLGSLDTETTLNIQLGYNNTTLALNGVENTSLGTVKTTQSGQEFHGFPSGEAFMTIELLGVRGPSALNLIALNNQKLFNTVKDTGTPQLYVDGSYSGMYTVGAEIILPAARAYDVLSYTSPATIKVIAPDGTAVTAADGTVLDGASADRSYVITPKKLGRYTVSYQSTDQAGQYISAEKSLVINDDIAPTVEFAKALPERVWVGTEVIIPQYTITDNGNPDNVTVDVFYRDAQGTTHNVQDGKFITDQAGTYVLMLYMVDENGTYNTQTVEILAVAREGK